MAFFLLVCWRNDGLPGDSVGFFVSSSSGMLLHGVLALTLYSRTFTIAVVGSSRTDPYDDVDDVTSSSALDVVEINKVVVVVVFVVGARRS